MPTKMHEHLPLAIFNQENARWKTHCLNRDFNLSKPATTMVLAADFGATLDLTAKVIGNCGQNDNAAIFVTCVAFNC